VRVELRAPLPFYVETAAQGGAAYEQACKLTRFQDCGDCRPETTR
jgi:hypothetical protein